MFADWEATRVYSPVRACYCHVQPTRTHSICCGRQRQWPCSEHGAHHRSAVLGPKSCCRKRHVFEKWPQRFGVACSKLSGLCGSSRIEEANEHSVRRLVVVGLISALKPQVEASNDLVLLNDADEKLKVGSAIAGDEGLFHLDHFLVVTRGALCAAHRATVLRRSELS